MSKAFNFNIKHAVKKFMFFIIAGIVWITIDRLFKIWILNNYVVGAKISNTFLGIFHLTFIKNTGAAFGIFANNPSLINILSCVMLFIILFFFLVQLYRESSCSTLLKLNTLQIFSVAIMCSGALSNIIDRFKFGFVVDYIELDFIKWPVFNIADIGVTLGVFLFAVSLLVFLIKADK